MSEQNNVLQLKKLAAKITGKTVANINGNTIADVLDIIQANYTAGGGGGGATITNITLNIDGNYGVHSGTVTMSSGSVIEIDVAQIDKLTLTATNGSATGKTKIAVSPAITSGNHYRYKIDADILPAKGEDLSSWTTWDGTSEISAQNGVEVFIAECDKNNKAVKCGVVTAVAPIF